MKFINGSSVNKIDNLTDSAKNSAKLLNNASLNTDVTDILTMLENRSKSVTKNASQQQKVGEKVFNKPEEVKLTPKVKKYTTSNTKLLKSTPDETKQLLREWNVKSSATKQHQGLIGLAKNDINRPDNGFTYKVMKDNDGNNLAVVITKNEKEPHLRLKYLVTNPDYSGSGAGESAMRHVKTESLNQGMKGVKLWSYSSSNKFYDKIGAKQKEDGFHYFNRFFTDAMVVF